MWLGGRGDADASTHCQESWPDEIFMVDPAIRLSRSFSTHSKRVSSSKADADDKTLIEHVELKAA